ncbi:hypothetical protein [uncultured Eudoraea sp.]|uniref:hypothetical protein n=1 Tax=uncultured Eudoraea sp. TaxID=1035614 RepID=UPI00262163B5|nr:hypothetical protein [uncultured Eudoraea sp.]
MNPIIRNILAVIAGWLIGSVINLSLIKIGHGAFPIEGIDPNDMEALANVMPTLDFKYFIFPFLAHALGTLIGAVIAGLIATNHKMKFALGIGVLFLIGGVLASLMLPAPTWFVVTDLAFAYIPMAWIGGKLAIIKKSKN